MSKYNSNSRRSLPTAPYLPTGFSVCKGSREEMEPPSELLQVLAKALKVPPEQPFEVLEQALTTLGIRVLWPSNAKRVAVGEWHRKLRHGDHVIVRSAGSNEVFHHAIYIGPYTPPGQDTENDYVVDMFGEPQDGKQGASLRLRKMPEFLKTNYEIAVLEYSKDTQAARDFTAGLALLAQALLGDVKGLYNLLGCNCDHFATWCRTLRWESPQREDIQRKVEGVVAMLVVFLANAATGAVASSMSSF
ncbi:hypothetical protein TSOC_014529 [Tetrabaena socialis]|uniref:LRAT domain-containing protein n=1 Tax=Tetrabaena socialis TaxID=47790 RepID=A0A2J7ZHF8_9CHLO|nr:hypothetical protein TSOC_014529 [Tetrabaena socialis]|eukprot:PNG99687.1 hypothetical protein TSOC_014529 [Tetrabaena socialis]